MKKQMLRNILLSFATLIWLFLSQAKIFADAHYLIDKSGSTGDMISAEGINLPQFLVSIDTSLRADIQQDYEVQRFREIQLSRELTEAGHLVHGDKVILNLLDNVQYTGSIDRTNVNINGTYSLRVRLDDYEFGYMLISTTRDRSLAKIRIPEKRKFYLIKSDPLSFQHYLLEIGDENRHYLESAPPLLPEDDDVRERRRNDKEDARYKSQDSDIPKRNPGPYDHAIIDILIIYTPLGVEWAEYAGGGIDNVVAQTMEISQLAIDNSNALLTFNLAHSGVVNYIESGDSMQDLTRVRSWWLGYMPEVHVWRNEYGADLVAFLAVMDDHGGAAWLLNSIEGRPDFGFSITRIQQTAFSYTFAHEIGHNMGLHHHPDQIFSPGPGIFDYSAGWRWTGEDNNRYCTVMSYESGQYYEDGLDHARVAHFSNPDIYHQGLATGDSERGDNARTLRETKHVVASYRERRYVVDEFPYTDSFEVSFPPHHWIKGAITGETQWQRSAGGHDNNPPGAADGNLNALFYGGDERGNSGYLITPEFDFRGRVNRRLTFSHAQAAREDDQDILNVYYRESRIDEWRRIASYTENTPNWTERIIDLPYTIDRMFIKFEAVTDNGYGVVIDNVRVDSESAADFPVPASNPYPAHESISVSVDLEALRWDYPAQEDYEDPAGFRVYFGTTDEFGEDDDFVWVPYEEDRERYSASGILPDLQIGRRYYWQVVPTTHDDGRRSSVRERRQTARTSNPQSIFSRNDAVNCPVWSFWTEGPLVDVSGRVIGNDAPDGLLDAVVIFSNTIDTFRVETGNNGEFTINNVEGSADGLSYTLTVTKEGYQFHTSERQVMAVALNLGNIRLEELAYKPRNLAAVINQTRDAVHLEWDAPEPGRLASDTRQRRRFYHRSSDYEKTRELEGYSVYRFDINDEDNYEEWDFLTFTENREYTDILWGGLDIAGYKYAVQAVYTDNVLSGFIHSDIISNQFSGGDGTEQSPWLISSVAELDRVRNYSGEKLRDKYFLQTADIDFAGTEWSEGEGWLPIGTSGLRFKGNYNGNRYIIANLMINREDENFIGLFGYCKEAALKNIIITNADVTGNRWTGVLVGDITGKPDNRGRIIGCSASGEVTGSSRVGGLAGLVLRSLVETSYAETNVTATGDGEVAAGGLIGFLGTESSACNSYAAGRVTVTNDGSRVAAFSGRISRATVTNCYAVGMVNAERATGGLIGVEYHSPTYNSYWNIETTQQDRSAGGEGRTTEEMTYPYDDETYVDWDFDEIWGEGTNGINDGYPFLRWQLRSEPDISSNPSPENNAYEVLVQLEQLSWNYLHNPFHPTPIGFRVYFNNTGEFDEDDDFDWVNYIEDQVAYNSRDLLPDSLEHGTKYYWKVIPTTRENGTGEGKDARSVPIWTFRTERFPYPVAAANPYPSDDTTGVNVDLKKLQWDYIVDNTHVNPAGFRVYFNDTGEFGEDDDFDWVPYEDDRVTFSSSGILPEAGLDYLTDYYWKVVPTTIEPNNRFVGRRRRNSQRYGQDSVLSLHRGDAENIAIWRFQTEVETSIEAHLPSLVTELKKNFPNPFNPETVIKFTIKEETDASLYIYNIRGQLVKTLHSGSIKAGEHRFIWKGKDDSGREAGSGVYFYRLTTDDYDKVGKMLLIK